MFTATLTLALGDSKCEKTAFWAQEVEDEG
jgi:hypothetical protein